MKKPARCPRGFRWAAALLILASGGVSLFGQVNYPLKQGKIEVAFALDGGAVPMNPTSSQAEFLTFFNDPNEGVMTTGLGKLYEIVNSSYTYNISGRSPIYGDHYYYDSLDPFDSCPSVLASLWSYPYMLVTPIPSSGSMANDAQTRPPRVSCLPLSHPVNVHLGNFYLPAPTDQATYLDNSNVEHPLNPGVRDNLCSPHWVDYRLDLAGVPINGVTVKKHYYGKSFFSSPLLWATAENDLANHTDPPSDCRQLADPVGAIHVHLFCRGTPLKVKSAWIAAILGPASSCNCAFSPCGPPYRKLDGTQDPAGPPGSPGTLQASLTFEPLPNTTADLDTKFFVRASCSYTVTVHFASMDSAGDVIGEYTVTTPCVPVGDMVDLQITVDNVFCDEGNGCVAAMGQLDMLNTGPGLGVYDNPAVPPYVQVYYGPFGNERWSQAVSPAANSVTCQPTNYHLLDVLPSNFVNPPIPYEARAQIYFQPNASTFEFMQTPARLEFLDCATPLCLDKLLVMDPAFLRGNIHLEGPPCGNPPSSCLQLIEIGSITPPTVSTFHYRVSYIGANGGSPSADAAGQAYGSIQQGTYTAPTGTDPAKWDGTYEIWLAGINLDQQSSWNPANELVLRLNNPDYNNDAQHRGWVYITPHKPTTLTAGSHTQDDKNYCFSEITLNLINQTPTSWIKEPKVTGEGHFVQNSITHDVYPTFYGTPTVYTPGNGTIRFCVPQGSYSFSPSFLSEDHSSPNCSQAGYPPCPTGETAFVPFSFNVGCKVCYNVTATKDGVGPIVSVTHDLSCTSQQNYPLQGTVQADAANGHNITDVSYTVTHADGSVASGQLCSGNCGVAFNLNGLSIPLQPCDNTVKITALDDQSPPLAGSATFHIILDSATLTLTAGTIAPCYPDVATAEAAAMGATTASGDCPVTLSASTSGDCHAIITVTGKDICDKTATVTYSTRIDSTGPFVVTPAGSLNAIIECDDAAGLANALAKAPSAEDNCSDYPLNIHLISDAKTTPNANCPQAYMRVRTWNFDDGCGNYSANFVQTITLKDTKPPVLSCPTQVTGVTCGNNKQLYFTVTALDACAGIRPVNCNPVSGSFFSVGTTIVNCTSDDGCNNVGSCSFPVVVTKISTAWASRQLGAADCYKLPVEASPISGTLANYHSGPWKGFDDDHLGPWFGGTFFNLPANIQSAQLWVRMKPHSDDQAIVQNDSIIVGMNSSGGGPTPAWRSYIGNGPGQTPSLIPGAWFAQSGCNQLFNLDLAAMPISKFNPNSSANLLLFINGNHNLDIAVEDDTTVDYARLCYCYCPSKIWWHGFEWETANAALAHGFDFASVSPLWSLAYATNFSVTLAAGASHGIELGLRSLNVGDVSNAVLTVQGETTRDTSTEAVRISGNGAGAMNVSLSALRSNVTQVQVTLRRGDTNICQGNFPALTGSNILSVVGHALLMDVIVTDDGNRYRFSLDVPHAISGPACAASGADGFDLTLIRSGNLDGNQLTSLTLAAQGLSEIQLRKAAVQVGRVFPEVTGQAVAGDGGGQLSISPFDVNAADGAGFSFGVLDASLLSIVIHPWFDACLFKVVPGKVKGGLKGKVHGEIVNVGSASFTETGAVWRASVDFSGIGASEQRFQLYNQSALVADTLGQSNVVTVGEVPSGWSLVASQPALRFSWPETQNVSVNGTPHLADELRILPVSPASSIEVITGLSMESIGAETLVLSAVEVPPPGWVLQVPSIGPSQISLQWTGPAGGLLESAPDVVGPWTTVAGQSNNSTTINLPQTNRLPAQFFRVRGN